MAHHRVPVVLLSLVAAFVLGPRIACATCGDGILDPGEECDPGPDVAGDCCTSTCAIMVTCPAPDECHDAGSCDLTTGLCSNPPKPDGTTCNTSGTCRAGRCATPMTIRLARLRGVHDGRPGAIVVLGKFVTVPPDTLSVRSGVVVHVTDAANLDLTIRWAPEECRPGIRGALCITKPVEKVQLPAHPDYYGVKLRLLALDSIHEPFQPPVTVTIMQDSNVDRVGTIGACTFPSRGGMNCQQPYGS
ncbi:MAG: hypothetical protein E6J70_01130 [Deltaproteobacteria bacterium]|nr:MAG: hypothetical protein E6J70_01130 [Deltaproteobacteria bacterium]